MKLVLSDRWDRNVEQLEVVLEGPSDGYDAKGDREKPLRDWEKPEPVFQIGTEEGRKALMDKLVSIVTQRTKQRTCQHPNQKKTGSAPGGSFTINYFHCPDCDKSWNDD